MADQPKSKRETHESRDPLSGEKGAHPVGTGVGAAVGGGLAGAALGAAGAGAATGAAVGAGAGPVGMVVGSIGGAIAGALAGHAVAESINPTVEDDYWRQNYQSRPYVERGAAYDEYRPAYRYGWESRGRHPDRQFHEVEPHLQSGWDQAREKSRLSWDKAKHAVRDAWDRVERPTGSAPTTKDRP